MHIWDKLAYKSKALPAAQLYFLQRSLYKIGMNMKAGSVKIAQYLFQLKSAVVAGSYVIEAALVFLFQYHRAAYMGYSRFFDILHALGGRGGESIGVEAVEFLGGKVGVSVEVYYFRGGHCIALLKHKKVVLFDLPQDLLYKEKPN